MRIGNTIIFLLLCLIYLSGCGKLEYHPYDGIIRGETGLTEKNLKKIDEELRDKTHFRFAFISDTQGFYDQTKDVVSEINSRKDIDFVIHGGDLTDFGLDKEFQEMRDRLLKLKMPWLTIIGNHDCVATGEHSYKKVFGALNYSFTIGTTRFIAMNTNAREYNYINVPDLRFLEKEVIYVEDANKEKEGTFTNTVLIMHSHPGDDQFNDKILPQLRTLLKRLPNPICLSGHTHSTVTLDCLGDGTPFHIIATVKKRQYYVFMVTPDHYDKEICDF